MIKEGVLQRSIVNGEQGDAHVIMRFEYRIEYRIVTVDALKPIIHLFESRLGGTYR